MIAGDRDIPLLPNPPSSDNQPGYRLLYEQIRSAILSGQLPTGARLPPSRTLAHEAGISRNTVLAAFDQLYAEGYLQAKRGSGTYVAPVLPDETFSPRAAVVDDAPQVSATRSLSKRGRRIAASTRMPLPAVADIAANEPAFQIGLPGLDVFPMDLWARCLTKRLRLSNRDLLGFNDPAGYRPLREALAAHLSTTRGVRCTADQIIIVTGSQQALDFCARMLLDPGDSAWIEDPGYLGARAALVAAGARLVPVPVDDHGLDVAAGAALDPKARLAFVTPSHQFPLGSTMNVERRLALIDWAQRNGAWVVEDDYDSEFRYIGRPLTALQGIDSDGRVLYTGTFSKVLFPALRLGYLIVPPDLVDAFTAAHLSSDVHAHVLEQAVLADFIADGHFTRHLRRMRLIYQERQTVLLDAVETTFGDALDVQSSHSGLHLVGWLPPTVDDRALAAAAARQNVHVWALSTHTLQNMRGPALLLGYAGATPSQITAGVLRLAQAWPGHDRARQPGNLPR